MCSCASDIDCYKVLCTVGVTEQRYVRTATVCYRRFDDSETVSVSVRYIVSIKTDAPNI
jgi:hypothetical protein